MNKRRHYTILTGGQVYPWQLQKVKDKNLDTIWIAVDSGAKLLLQNNIFPDILIGDFDSIALSDLQNIQDNGSTEIFKFPAEKDASDTYLALEAIKKMEVGGYAKLFQDWNNYYFSATKSSLTKKWQENTMERPLVDILGASGSRQDHSLANYLIGFSFCQDFEMVYWNQSGLARLCIGNESRIFSRQSDFPYFSIIPLSDKLEGLSLLGFRYPLDNYTVKQEQASLLISNEIVAEHAKFMLKEGRCIIFQVKD